MRELFATYGTHGPLGRVNGPAQQEKAAEMVIICTKTARNCCWSYHTVFPTWETPYNLASGISRPFGTHFGTFPVPERRLGGCFLQHRD
jgi:hypothetical protein